jgi:hypothetical protein
MRASRRGREQSGGEARVRARQLASAAASQTRSGGSFRDTSRLCHKNAAALASHAGRESAACMLRVSYTRAPRAGLCRSWCRLGVDLGPPLGEIGAIAGQLRTEFGDCMVTSPCASTTGATPSRYTDKNPGSEQWVLGWIQISARSPSASPGASR